MPSRNFRSSRRPQFSQIALGPWGQGVNENAEPHTLEYSELQDALNVVFDDKTGRVKKRPGTRLRSTITALDNPPVRGIRFTKTNGQEILVVTDNHKIAYTEDLAVWTDITPAAFLTDGEFTAGTFYIDFAVGEGKIWVTNGSDPVCSWDGVSSSMVVYDQGTAELQIDGDPTLVTQVSISGTALDRSGDGTTWVGQKIVCTDSAHAANIGQAREITAFDDSTNKITFDAFPDTLSNNDKFIVGVNIPRGRHIAFHHDTLFIACTSENPSEIRFSDDVDPNEPSIFLTADNPNAWPATNQIEIAGASGDRIRGFTSPIYRNRLGVFKSVGIYRIEPSAEFKFQPVTITEQFGSRFPKSFQQHGNVLMFLGQDADGKSDIYMTDFVTVTSFNRKHSTTIDGLSQPDAVSRDRSIASDEDFDSGIMSSFAAASGGGLIADTKDTAAKISAIVKSGTNIDVQSTPGRISVLGNPKYDIFWQGAGSPALSYPGIFNEVLTGDGQSLPSGGVRYLTTSGSGGSAYYYAENQLDSGKDTFATIHWSGTGLLLGLANGSKSIYVNGMSGAIQVWDNSGYSEVTVAQYGLSQGSFKVLLKANGTYKIWVSGYTGGVADSTSTLVKSGTAASTAVNKISAGLMSYAGSDSFSNAGTNASTILYMMGVHTDFLGDSLDSIDGKISPTSLPDTLPATGQIDLVNDYKEELSDVGGSFSKFFIPTEYEGSATWQVNTSLPVITESSSSDDVTYSAPNSFTSGNVPASTAKRYSKISITLDTGDFNCNSFHAYEPRTGFLWKSGVLSVGTDITSWDIVSIVAAAPPTGMAVKIRIATEDSLGALDLPVAETEDGWLVDELGSTINATDAHGWIAISDGDNIGSILGGNEDSPNPPSPDARFIQFKVTGYPNTYGESHLLDSITAYWTDSGNNILPVEAVIWEKKWLLTCATLDSSVNDTIVCVDSNRSISNWSSLNTNLFVWYKGKLLIGNSERAELLELTGEVLSDDGGPSGDSRATNPIEAYIVTKQEAAGSVFSRKKAMFVDVIGSPEASQISLYSKSDVEESYTQMPSATMSSSISHARSMFPRGRQFKRLSLKVSNAEVGQDLALEGLVISIENIPSRSGL